MGKALENLARRFGEPNFLRGPSAPGWIVSALKLPDEETVSGAGADVPTARMSCLGEAAEYLSIQRRTDDQNFDTYDLRTGSVRSIYVDEAVMSDRNDPRDPGTEGCAAGETVELAIRGALCERVERHVLAEWWDGDVMACRYPEDWLSNIGIVELVHQSRNGAEEKRDTEIFSLGHLANIHIAVAISSGVGDIWTIAGYGASLEPSVAVFKATSELFQMECGAAIARVAGKRQEIESIQLRSERLSEDPSLFSETDGVDVRSYSESFDLQKITGKTEAIDLSRDDIGVPTFRVICSELRGCRSLKYSSVAAPV